MGESNPKGADTARDRELGMNRAITRRDFLNGVAIGRGALTNAWHAGVAFGDATIPPFEVRT